MTAVLLWGFKMNNKDELLRRFLRYVAITSQSNASVESVPSTKGQTELANLLAKDLEELGYRNYYKTENPIYHVTIKSLLDRDFNIDKKFDCLRNLELEVEELRQERTISYSKSS